jgi:hypothetical protein
MVREDWRKAALYQMRRQRWSEAGRYRRLAVILLVAQAFVMSIGLGVLTRELPSSRDGNLGVAALLIVVASIVVIALHFIAASAVLRGSLRGRIFATLLSAASYLFWFPQYVLWVPPTGWLSWAVTALTVVTCAVVWLRDPAEGVAGIGRPPRPLT